MTPAVSLVFLLRLLYYNMAGINKKLNFQEIEEKKGGSA